MFDITILAQPEAWAAVAMLARAATQKATTAGLSTRVLIGLPSWLSVVGSGDAWSRQLVQLLVVTGATAVAPPVAVTPVKDGIEKKVLAQADAEPVPMAATFVSVTVALELGPTTMGLVKV